MRLSFHPLNLRLKQPFRIARETRNIQDNIIVSLHSEDGTIGYGEASPTSFFGEDIHSTTYVLARSVDMLKDTDPFLIEDITSCLHEAFPNKRAPLAAIDMALHDIIGKKLNIPLYKLLGLNGKITRITSYTIGIDSVEKMCEKVKEAKGFPVLKIKVGMTNDVEILKELRKLTDAVFRIDVNTGWTEEEAIRKLKIMEGLGVELVEQPLPVRNFLSLKRIKRRTNIPIFVDEDVRDSKDIHVLSDAVDGINIKLMKCGGIREAIRMIHTARAHGLKIMLGCNIESSVAITAAAHITSLVDYVDLDGNLLVTNDHYTGVKVANGRLILPEDSGLGIKVRNDTCRIKGCE